MRIVVCDDEPLARERLVRIVRTYAKPEIYCQPKA